MGQYYKVITRNSTGTKVYDRSVDGEYTMAKLMEHGYLRNMFCRALAETLVDNPTRVCWVGDYAEPEECVRLGFTYDEVWNDDSTNDVGVKSTQFQITSKKYLVNNTRKQVVDITEYAKTNCDDYGCVINPITILTCLGNGRGGGDFYPSEKSTASYVGQWAFDEIYITDTLPTGYKMIHPVFKED